MRLVVSFVWMLFMVERTSVFFIHICSWDLIDNWYLSRKIYEWNLENLLTSMAFLMVNGHNLFVRSHAIWKSSNRIHIPLGDWEMIIT